MGEVLNLTKNITEISLRQKVSIRFKVGGFYDHLKVYKMHENFASIHFLDQIIF